MIGPESGEPPGEHAIVLATILRAIPGNHSEIQGNRMLTAIPRLRSVISHEGSHFLDCYNARARIYEPRLTGYRVTTIMRAVLTESGVIHHVGGYILEGAATYPLFDGLDDKQVAA
jgi:hypothetical protein